VSIDAVFAIAKQQKLWGRSYAITFAGTVKEVLGSCHMLGITVGGHSALAIQGCIKGQRQTSRRKIRRKRQQAIHRGSHEGSNPGKNEGKRAGITQASNAQTEKEKQEGPLECPIPNEEGVLPFIRADGTLEVSLCRTTFMTPTEKAERQALAIKKRMEVRGEKCSPCQDCHGGYCPKVDPQLFK